MLFAATKAAALAGNAAEYGFAAAGFTMMLTFFVGAAVWAGRVALPRVLAAMEDATKRHEAAMEDAARRYEAAMDQKRKEHREDLIDLHRRHREERDEDRKEHTADRRAFLDVLGKIEETMDAIHRRIEALEGGLRASGYKWPEPPARRPVKRPDNTGGQA
jgi:DNA-binding protein H-NS